MCCVLILDGRWVDLIALLIFVVYLYVYTLLICNVVMVSVKNVEYFLWSRASFCVNIVRGPVRLSCCLVHVYDLCFVSCYNCLSLLMLNPCQS